MKQYIKKTELLAMQFDGSIAQLVDLQKRYGKDFDITPDEKSLVFVPKKLTEGKPSKTLSLAINDWLVEHNGNIHIVDPETFRNEYYLARQTDAKSESKPEARKATKPEPKKEESFNDAKPEPKEEAIPQKQTKF